MRCTGHFPQISILDGSFEDIPVASESINYVYSLFAFHWTTDVDRAVSELARILKPGGEMDLFFIGRNNGREFIQRTTPIFLRYMGPSRLLESARMRKQLTKDEAYRLFARVFDPSRLSVHESYDSYYDSLEGHLGWWVRIEGQMVQIPAEKRGACDQDVRQALSTLQSEKGIPYTIHQLHVRLRNDG
jgi:ubiquinone/menaquinone biosynthesis C-methylase UbiE